ncbi:MAG: ABC transporter ATP-binding protein, partial [Anaerolineae bacterium]|nr:ABC transporter ATP-binding protein [Anaerolineae bacterium]
MLEVKGVSVMLGGQVILQDIDFSLTRGAVTAVIGPNGAGKTTLLRAISRVLPLAGGEVWLEGRRINHLRPDALAREV